MIESFAIHTAVLVGLLVTWTWTERMGGVFAGFAVPGYLAAISLVAPSSAVAIAIEAVLTYGLAWLLGEGLPRLGLTSRVFGRERFLLFVLASVPVRLWVEGAASDGLASLLGPWLSSGPTDGFFGVGLVLVPLLANALWKLGLVRGVAQVAGTTLTTVLLLWFVVMPIMQLEFSSFLLSFEDIATDFVAVPKVYILLLCTAFIATWTAERYGWNAGGLLVPALLGLLILEPVKLGTTFVEIVLLTVLYRFVSSLPGVRRIDLAGPRRLVLMYMMAWALKLALAWIGLQLELPIAAWDVYGFGYLLSSLVAVRCLDLRPMGRVLLPMGLNIGLGAVVGLSASTALVWALPMPVDPPAPASSDPALARLTRSILLAAGEVREDPNASVDAARVGRGLARLATGDHRLAKTLSVQVLRRTDGSECRHLRPDRSDASGPNAWWCGGDGPVLYVPRPRSDPDSVWAAARLLDSAACSGVVMDGVDAEVGLRGAADRLASVLRPLVGRRVLLLQSAVSESRVEPRTEVPTVRLPGVDGAVPVHLGGQVGGALWSRLRPGDGRLVVSVPELEAGLPNVASTASGRAPDRGDPALDQRASWLVRLALSRARRSSSAPRGLAWAAAQLDVGLYSDGQRWTLESNDRRGFGRWILRPGSASGWIVAAPGAAEAPGLERAALELAEVLQARAVWVGQRGTRGLEPRLHGLVDGPDVAVAALREALRPAPHHVGRVVVVRRTSSSIGFPTALLAGATEAQRPPQDLGDAVTSLWSGALLADDIVRPPPSLGGTQPLRYLHALEPGTAWALWLRGDVLAEVQGTPARQMVRRWYGLRGIRQMSAGAFTHDLAVGPSVRDEASLASLDELQAHLRLPTSASLARLVRSGEPVLVTSPLRLRVGLVRRDAVCLATLGSPESSRCWGRE